MPGVPLHVPKLSLAACPDRESEIYPDLLVSGIVRVSRPEEPQSIIDRDEHGVEQHRGTQIGGKRDHSPN